MPRSSRCSPALAFWIPTARGALHGFGIGRRISRGVCKANAGSLLAFHRMERAGPIEGEWRQTENTRR